MVRYVCRFDVGDPKPECPEPTQSRGRASDGECLGCLAGRLRWERGKTARLGFEVKELKDVIPALAALRPKILEIVGGVGSLYRANMLKFCGLPRQLQPPRPYGREQFRFMWGKGGV